MQMQIQMQMQVQKVQGGEKGAEGFVQTGQPRGHSHCHCRAKLLLPYTNKVIAGRSLPNGKYHHSSGTRWPISDAEAA